MDAGLGVVATIDVRRLVERPLGRETHVVADDLTRQVEAERVDPAQFEFRKTRGNTSADARAVKYRPVMPDTRGRRAQPTLRTGR